MTQDERTQSWWHTMPGMLTGGAAVITAITGLFPAFNQAGSAPEGEVAFHVPTAAKALALQIKVAEETTEIGLQP